MEVKTNLEGSKLTVAPEGKIGTTTAAEFENVVKSNIDGVTELIFDFKNVEYLTSAGIRVLMSAGRVMKKQGAMKIINVNPEVMDVFTFTGMADVMDIEAV